jgi:hypothetical protein
VGCVGPRRPGRVDLDQAADLAGDGEQVVGHWAVVDNRSIAGEHIRDSIYAIAVADTSSKFVLTHPGRTELGCAGTRKDPI